MTIGELVDYYGNGYQFKKRTKMSGTVFYNWCRQGYVPIASQFRLQELTDGVLKANFSDIVRKKRDR